jgi:hypothetical protein
VKRAVERGVEGQVPPADFLVDDGANLQSPGVGRESSALVTNLSRQAHANRPMP